MASLKPLVVDLDGTLIKTDLLWEAINSLVLRNPLNLLKIIRWALLGKSYLKFKIASQEPIKIDSLPFNNNLIKYLKLKKAEGRLVVLCTGSDQRWANLVANHLDVFDASYGSSQSRNLCGENKKLFLISLYGEFGYDYIGNSIADIEPWSKASTKFLIGQHKKILQKLQALDNFGGCFEIENRNKLISIIALGRPIQWSKNLLIFIPLFGAHLYASWGLLSLVITAFLIFNMATWGIYALNDLFDINEDRLHPIKKGRPIASGALSIPAAWTALPVLIMSPLFFAFHLLPFEFFLCLLAYMIVASLYSRFIKKIVLFDVFTLSFLYIIRIISGAYAIDIDVSFWLLTFSFFFFLNLALLKRSSELKMTLRISKRQLIPGRGYIPNDILIISCMGIASGYISSLVLALYIQDPQIVQLYTSPRVLWLCSPLLLLWISRIWLLAIRSNGLLTADPVSFTVSDRISLITGIIFIAIFIVAMTV